MASDEKDAEKDGDEAKPTETADAKPAKASAKKASEKGSEKPKHEPAAARSDAVEAHGHGHAHGHKPDRKEIFVVFGALFALTVLEVIIAQVPGIPKMMMGTALVGLAVTKAAIVGLFYMHLKHETRVLKLTVALPMATPAFYAFVLVADAVWRLTR